MAQSAAQAAAVAAAEEVATAIPANEQAVANAMAKLNGFDTTLASNPATVTLTVPTTGNFTGAMCRHGQNADPYDLSGRVRAWDGYGAGVATAIAGVDIQPDVRVRDCTLSVSGGSTLNASGCGIFNNSSANNTMQVSGGSTINATTMAAASTGWYPGITGSGDHINVPVADIVQGASTTCTAVAPTVPTFVRQIVSRTPRWWSGGQTEILLAQPTPAARSVTRH